jgi:hypothetical protein
MTTFQTTRIFFRSDLDQNIVNKGGNLEHIKCVGLSIVFRDERQYHSHYIYTHNCCRSTVVSLVVFNVNKVVFMHWTH